MKSDKDVAVPHLAPGETAGPFTIKISDAELRGVMYRASLPGWKRWLFDWTPFWRWL